MNDELLDVVGQACTAPEDVPGTAEEDVAHPSVVRSSEGEVLPAHWFGSTVNEDPIYHAESRFKVGVSVVVRGSKGLVIPRDRLEHSRVKFVVDALALDGEVEECLGAEVCLVPELGDHHKRSGWRVETFKYGVVKPFEWSGWDAIVPNDLGDELHDIQHNVFIRGLLEHPGDAIRIQHVTVPISFFTKWGGLAMGWTEGSKLVVMTPTGGARIAQRENSTGAWPQRSPFLTEYTSKPRCGPLEVSLVFIVATNHGVNNEGDWSLEWAVEG